MTMHEMPQTLHLQLGDYSKLPDIKDANNLQFHAIRRQKGARLLGFYGIPHHAEFTHPDHGLLRTEFRNFERRTRGWNRIIVSEGRVAEAGDNEQSSFKDGRAQSALVAYWAKEHNIPIISGEPDPFMSEGQLVAPRFTKVDDADFGKKLTFYYYSGRQLTQYARMPHMQRPTPEEYLKEWFEKFQSVWDWENFDFSYTNLKAIHKTLYETPLDPMDANFFLDQTSNFGLAYSPVQQVAQKVNQIRDMTVAYTHLELIEPGITDSIAFGNDAADLFSKHQAQQKKAMVDATFGFGAYSTFDCHGTLHSMIVEPVLNTWGFKDF